MHLVPVSLDDPQKSSSLVFGAISIGTWRLPEIRRPGSACTVFFSYVASKILSQPPNPKSPFPQTPKISKIQNPRSPKSKIQNPQIPKSPKSKIQNPQDPKSKIPQIQNPKSKIPQIQNPKSPNSKIQTLHIKICYIMFQKSKIQNPQNPENPKSKIPKIQNPKSPKSKIQNPLSPKSKIPKIQNPVSPKSKIQNSKSPPKFLAKFSGFWILDFGSLCSNSLCEAPKFGLGILDFGFGIPAPKSKIQTPQNPKSKIPKIQNLKSPKSKIQNPKSSAEIQNLGRWGPHVKNCFLMMPNPKSKIPKIRPKKFGF